MSFNVYSHSKLECLATLLAHQQKKNPLKNFFEEEIICVSNPIVHRWLSVQLATQNGIEANNDYPLAANLIWSLLKKAGLDCPEKDPLSLESLVWRIIPLIDELQDTKEFNVIKYYLSDDLGGIKQWQLARKIADVLDRYQYHRPDLLMGRKSKFEGWLELLWQRIISDVPNHKLKLIFQFMKKAHAGQIDTNLLPRRIQVFAPSLMPKVIFQFFEQLSNIIEVNFYIVSPTNQYWGDLSSPKKIAKARLLDKQEIRYLEMGNHLLSSWGKVGQIFHNQLILSDRVSFNIEQENDIQVDSLLKAIQNDIFTLENGGSEIQLGDRHFSKPLKHQQRFDNDNSIIIHQCHSRMRECQVLHDQILDIINEDETIFLEDILVLSPDISDYAIFIETVFSPTRDKPYLPWNINDIPLVEAAPIYDVFLDLFDLPESRFTQSDVLQFLALKAVQKKFDISPEEVELIKKWIKESHIHWAKDKKHKMQLGLPAIHNNTWQFGLDRMMASYTMGANQSFENLVSMRQIDGIAGETLGKLNIFYNQLCEFSKKISSKRTPEQWQSLINEMLEKLFEEESENHNSQTIRECVNDWIDVLRGSDFQKTLSSKIVKKVLEEKLQSSAKQIAFMSGGITFSSMKPLRNIPAKVVVILGLNEQDFPRKETRPEFDIYEKAAYLGDPTLAEEDRYLFLETLMSAREKIIFSYLAYSLKDNSEKQPSILLSELIEYINQYFGSSTLQSLLRRHYLQPYANFYYKKGEAFSYDRFWLKMTNQNKQVKKRNWQNNPALRTEIKEVNLDDLLYFYKNPSASFIRRHLKINLEQKQKMTENDEPISLDNLQKYQIKKLLAETTVEKKEAEEIKTFLSNSGILPIEKIGNSSFLAILEQSKKMQKQIQSFEIDGLLEKAFEYSVELEKNNHLKITGQIRELFSQRGILIIRPGNTNGPDYLSLWIKFLILKLIGQQENAYIISDAQFEYFNVQKITQEQAEDNLKKILTLYVQGLNKPIALFKHTSFDVACRLYKGNKPSQINKLAKWYSGYQDAKGDMDDPAISLLMRGVDAGPVESDEFINLIEKLYLPMLDNLQKL